MKMVMAYEDGKPVGPVCKLEDSDYAAGEELLNFFLSVYPKSLPLGLALLKRCRNAETWIDRQGAEHKVSEIHADYAANIRRWLEQRARLIHLGAWVSMTLDGMHPLFGPRGDLARDDFEDGVEELREMDPVEYVKTTKLYQALVKRA